MMQSRLWAVLVALSLVFVALILMRPLLPIDETRYLAVAWEMRLSADPVHLTKNFGFYTHKTPLLFVMINLVWLITGISEFAARFVGPACGVAMVAGTAVLARRFWPARPELAVRAALILSGFAVFLIYASATMFDALLSLAVLAGVAALWRIGQGGATRNAWGAFGLALALGVYAKGPVILVHLLPLLLTIRLWAPQPPRLAQAAKGFGFAFLLALGLVAIWLVPALITATPEYRTELLWTQSAARVAGGMAHDRPVWFLTALLPLILFPWGWSWRLWGGVARNWRADPAARLCVIWAVSALVLFSLISGKQIHYLLPAFPAMALLFAMALPAQAGRGGSLVWLPLTGLAVVMAALGTGALPLPNDIADLTPLWPLLALGGFAALLALAVWRLPILPAHLLAGVGLTLGLHGLIVTTSLYPEYDSQHFAALLAPHVADGLATTNAEYNAEFNFALRLTAPVATPQSAPELAAWAAAHPNGVIFGQKDQDLLTAAPQEVLRYMGKDWAIWPAAAATSRE
jgi:4-amino-4-deoxy-L-arabinose transferase-like glycosyltransferase